MHSIISPDNNLAIWGVLMASSAFGVYAEKKGWIKNIAGVMYTMIITAVLALVHFIPYASGSEKVPVYDYVYNYITPMAIPLLLFSANLVKIIKESGRLIAIYLIGAVGIVIGAIISFFVIHLGPETYKVAGVFIATLVGGSVNFVAASHTLNFDHSSLFTTAMAVDNFGIQFYLIFLFYLPFIKVLQKYYPELKDVSEEEEMDEKQKKEEEERNRVSIGSLVYVITIAGLATWASAWIGSWLQQVFHTKANLNLLVVTIIMTLFVSLFPKFFEKLERVAFSLGMALLYIFLAVVGAASNIKTVFLAGPGVFLFATFTLLIQFIIIMALGKLFKFSLKEIAIASCANVSGPTLSAPMAASFKAKNLITPAVLVGILGYIIGTFLGVSVGFWLAP
jgi:uncharacterized membrane protein